jgi:hypothetical protein
MRKLALWVATFAALTALLPAIASAQTRTSSVYAVKFVCGLQSPAGLTPPSEPPVKPGNYATKINLELVLGEGAQVTANVSVAGLTSTAPLTLSLTAPFTDEDITCADIATAIASLYPNGAPPAFVNGYVNIIPPNLGTTLAVTAVYTAQGYYFSPIGSVFLPPRPNAQVSIDVVPESPITVALPNG